MTRIPHLLFAILLLALATGCTRLVEEEPTPTPLPTPVGADKPIFTAARGSIIETVKGLGRVAASDEAVMYFRQSGRLKQLHVELGQRVKSGDMLAELETGNLGTQLAEAQIQFEIAQIGLQRAVDRSNTADPALRTAAARIAQSEASRAQAMAALQKLQAGASTADIQAADAAVAEARSRLGRAQADLSRITAPRSPDELAAAQAALDKSRSVLAQAQAAYDRIAGRSDAAGRPEAIALQQATSDHQAAEARYRLATSPPRTDEVAATERAVESAQAALNSATTRRAQVAGGAAPGDLSTAQANLEAANANLEAARADYEARVAAAGLATANYDVQIAQKQVELATVKLKTFEEQLQESQLKAPFDGLITSTSGREGDQVNAYTPIVVLADPSSILVALELSTQDLGKVALGQPATLALDAFRGQTFDSKVVGLPNAAAGPQPQALARTVKLEFVPPGPVDLGALANVTITTQQKEDVLLIPNAAVRQFGGRRYVQVLAENGRRREVDVETGIRTDSHTEIIRGIAEGARVVSQ